MKFTWFSNCLLGLLLVTLVSANLSQFPHEEDIKIINGEEFVQTPFGLMLRECVQNVPSGTRVRESEDGYLHLTHEKKEFSKKLPRNEKCLKMDPTRKLKQWIDNSGWDLSANTSLSKFEANYFVPNTPRTTNDQYLYYFIGSQNSDGSGPGLSIIQPVLSYHQGWYFQSWNCCPDGQAINTEPFFNITPRDQVYGSVEVKDSQVTIISQNKQGQQSVLTVDQNNRNFTWIDATLEVYFISNCTDYPLGKMLYSKMNVTLSDGSKPLPNWDNTGITECNGKTTVVNPKTISISHNFLF